MILYDKTQFFKAHMNREKLHSRFKIQLINFNALLRI